MENKWMTREEFEKLCSWGLCWVVTEGVYPCLYNGEYYQDAEYPDHTFILSEIKAVMQIEKPEYPEEIK